MNVSKLMDSQAGMAVAGVLAAGVVIYLLGRAGSKAAKDAADAVLRVNDGTPYEGWGALGTWGNITNEVFGGKLETIGSAIGTGLADVLDWIHKPFDPNNPNTPALRKAASFASPVRPEDARKVSAQVN